MGFVTGYTVVTIDPVVMSGVGSALGLGGWALLPSGLVGVGWGWRYDMWVSFG